MTGICVSAPGKAVIAGEYAVLFGAPALVTAINCRATVRIVASDDRFHHVSVPGLADGRWRFQPAPGGRIEWHDDVVESLFDLFEYAWRHCAGESAEPVAIEIDTRAFFDSQSGVKYGLGSSAAATAALTAALISMHGDNREAWPLAKRIHRDFQQGRGSGVDVAASVFGGLQAYRMADADPPHRLAWPRTLHSRFLWSGTAADTRDKLKKLSAQGNIQPAALIDSAEAVASSWDVGVAGGIIEALRRYVTVLSQFSDALDLGIFDAGHGALLALAKALDVVYKPCGAGGGDIGVVLAESDEAVVEFCEQAARSGFTVPGLERDPQGLSRLEEDRT